MKTHNMWLIRVFAIWKVLTILFIVLSYYSLPQITTANRSYSGSTASVFAPFINWDGQHYLNLAENGYPKKISSVTAFYPLYPMIVRIFNNLFGHLAVSAILVSLTSSFLFMYFFFYTAQALYNSSVAKKATLLFITFPASFYMSVAYTEALFLMLLFGFIYFFYVRRSFTSLLFSFLLPFSRAQGFFIIPALILFPLINYLVVSFPFLKGAICLPEGKIKMLTFMNIMSLILGVGGLLLTYKITSDNYFAASFAQQFFIFKFSTSNLFDLPRFLRYLGNLSFIPFAFNNGFIDKVFVVLAFGSTYFFVKCRSNALFLLIYLGFVVPTATVGQGSAYVRFALLAFTLLSLFLVQSLKLKKVVLIAVVFLILQCLFISRFATNLWVA